jgi:hypothetical protein
MLGMIFSNLYGLLSFYSQVLFPLQDLRLGKSGNKLQESLITLLFFCFMPIVKQPFPHLDIYNYLFKYLKMKKNLEKFIDVNGFQVMDLTPDMSRALALVDLDVLIKLTSYLGKASFRTIKHDLVEELRSVSLSTGDVGALQKLVHICDEFSAFHKTVNIIQEINHPMNVTKHQLDDEPITGTNLSDLD